MLTQEILKSIVEYDSETGMFRWKKRLQKRKNDWFSGYLQTDGYMQLRILNKMYMSHRLAWLYIHGKFPENIIDHINKNKSDNRIVNLREATHSQNQQNTDKKSNNKSGYKGVAYEKIAKKWRAQISIKGKRIHIGYFNTPEEASIAYKNKSNEIFTHN